MRHLLLLPLLFAPLSAHAQILVTLNGSPTPSNTVGVAAADCGHVVAVQWTATPTTVVCTDLVVWATQAGSCANAPANDDVEILRVSAASVTSVRSGAGSIRVSDLPGQNGDGGFVCGSMATKTWKICAEYDTPGFSGITTACGTNPGHATGSATVQYDGQPPPSPTLIAVQPLNGGLRAQANYGSDTFAVRFGSRLTGSADDYAYTSGIAVVNAVVQNDLTGLKNGTSYDVVAVAVDAAGNVSEPSSPLTGTPEETHGFFQAYKEAGGTEQGGCQAVSFGPATAAALLVARLLRRKRS